jgi:hypothetical protein
VIPEHEQRHEPPAALTQEELAELLAEVARDAHGSRHTDTDRQWWREFEHTIATLRGCTDWSSEGKK